MSDKACQKKTSIGGQALIEGIMMRGPHRTVMACRLPDGGISVEDVPVNSITKKIKILRLPILRGAVNLVESMILGYRTLMLSAERSGMLDEEETGKDGASTETTAAENASTETTAAETASAEGETPTATPAKKKDGWLMPVIGTVATVLGLGLALLLFMYLPSKLFDLLNGWTGDALFPYKALFEGVLKLVIFLCYMIAVSRMKDIRRVFRYHGAEHKSIFCYEKGLPLTVENVRAQSRFHPRCGTSFLILMLLVSILFYAAVLQIPAVKAFAGITWLWAILKLLLLPVICGLGYELIKFCGRHDNWLTRIISAPGMWVQRISTQEPDDAMIEVAIAALQAVIPEQEEDDRW